MNETISLLDLAIRRSWDSDLRDPALKSLIHGALEAAKQELTHLKNATAGPPVEEAQSVREGQQEPRHPHESASTAV